METLINTRALSPNPYFSQVASEARINKAAAALKANGIAAIVVQTGEEARAKVRELLPIEEYSYPLEDARAREAYGIGSGINKVLIVNREFRPGRITAILVKENLGF